jgi:hypothetical protein
MREFKGSLSANGNVMILVQHDLGGFDHLQIVSQCLTRIGFLTFKYVMHFFLFILVVQKCPKGFRPFHNLVLAKSGGE